MDYRGNLIKKIGEREGEGMNGHWKIASYLLRTVDWDQKHLVVEVADGMVGRIANWDALIGQNVEIKFDIDAREWKGRWFNTLRAYAIKSLADLQVKETPEVEKEAEASAESQDLPF